MNKNNKALKALAQKKAAAGDDTGRGFYKESAKYFLGGRGISRKEMKQLRNEISNRTNIVAQMQRAAVKGGALPSPQRGGNSGFLGGGGFRKGGR